MASKFNKTFFAGGANLSGSVYGKGDGSRAPDLASILRYLLNGQARANVRTQTHSGFNDVSGGTVVSVIPDFTIPSTPYNAVAGGGASLTEFNAAIAGAMSDLYSVLVFTDLLCTQVGADTLTRYSGGPGSGVLGGIDAAVTAVSGTAAVDFTTGVAALLHVKEAGLKILKQQDKLAIAMGYTPDTYTLDIAITNPATFAAVTPASASATGASAISKAQADAVLTSIASMVSSIAQRVTNIYYISTDPIVPPPVVVTE